MEPEKTINPELMLRAAELVSPENEWLVSCEGGEPSVFTNYFSNNRQYFDPRLYDKDLKFLMLALMKEHEWNFNYERDEYQAWREHSKPIMVGGMPGQEISTELLSDESFPLLLLKAVSAMTGVPLYV
jgi:hypothetical protein